MVAIVSGNSLGVSLTSLATLGQHGVIGQAAAGSSGEQAFVNVANGNLVVQDTDDLLLGLGVDAVALRTYNSQGILDDDNGDNWSSGVFTRNLLVTGTVGAAGSTVQRIAADGAKALYTWVAEEQAYRTTDGAGAHDLIRFDAATARFRWIDGDTGSTEEYRQADGKLVTLSDGRGNAAAYEYNAAGRLSKVTTASGDSFTYAYHTGTNRLQSITTTAGDGSLSRRVSYAYVDNRLTKATVDLSPGDLTTGDGKVYGTTYEYKDGLLTRITQDDGHDLSIQYEGGKVRSVTDPLGYKTTFSYQAGRTLVTDALNRVTTYEYDAAGRLTAIKEPPVGGVSHVTAFAYDEAGDLTKVTQPGGRYTETRYVGGNLVMLVDKAGNAIDRTYNEQNQLLTETMYTGLDADGLAGLAKAEGAQIARFIYADNGLDLRFTISPEGRVTEHRYDARHQRIRTFEYVRTGFDMAGSGAEWMPSLGQLEGYVALATADGARRTDYEYDFDHQSANAGRSVLKRQTTWSELDATGQPAAGAVKTVRDFVYDPFGTLREAIVSDGGGPLQVTRYEYDGLGRLTSERDALERLTVYSYDSANNKIATTVANGLVTTRVLDKVGRLVSQTQSQELTSFGTTRYWYDKLGRLLQTQDPTGVRSWSFYDEAGRKVGAVDGDGSVTEFLYDADDRVTRTIAYARAVAVASLVDAAGSPQLLQFSSVRPVALPEDRSSWNIYDDAGRLLKTVDADGRVTENSWDGASRLVQVRRYATLKDTAALGNTPADFLLAKDATFDRVTRHLYDADGRLRGTLDGEGYLTEFEYDTAGQLRKQTRYAGATAPGVREAGKLPDLRGSITEFHEQQQSTWFIRNSKGQLVGHLDAEGWLTENAYDPAGNLSKVTRYGGKLTGEQLGKLAATSDMRQLRPVDGGQQVTEYEYDKLNRLETEKDFQGTVTRHYYDAAGNRERTERAANTDDVRKIVSKFDVQGRLVGELSARGAALLTGSQSVAEVDQVWRVHGTAHTYDAAGRRTSTTDASGGKTVFYYDEDGRNTHTVGLVAVALAGGGTALQGEVTQNVYDPLGQLKEVIRYGSRITNLTGITGGLVNATLTTALTRNNALDSRTTYTYTRTGQVDLATEYTSATGSTFTDYDYNTFGEQKQQTRKRTDFERVVDTYDRDRRGFSMKTTHDAGGIAAVTLEKVDAFGRVTEVTDANGHVRKTGYDRLGRVVTLTNAFDQLLSETSYDAFGRTYSLQDTHGTKTSFTYDAVERSVTVTRATGAAAETVVTWFDRLGQRTKVADAAGGSTLYTYDKDGRLDEVRQQRSDGTWLVTEDNDYDTAGRLATSSNGAGNLTRFVYDAASRLITRTVEMGAGVADLVTTYTYDAKGQQIAIQEAGGTRTELTYDLLGRLAKRVVDPGGLKLLKQFEYDGTGNVVTLKAGTDGATPIFSTVTEYGFDKLGRRTREVVDPRGLALTRTWEYDDAGNPTAQVDATGNRTRYVYDAADRLVFTINALGEVTEEARNIAGQVTMTRRYSVRLTLDELQAVTDDASVRRELTLSDYDAIEHRVYDAHGRLAATGTAVGDGGYALVTFRYDGAGRLVERVAHADAVSGWTEGVIPAAPVDEGKAERLLTVYDKLGQARFTVDGNGALVETSYDNAGRLSKRVAYAKPVEVGTPRTLDALTAAAAGLRRDDDEVQWLEYDAAGRMTRTADGTGSVTRHTYDANGNVTSTRRFATAAAVGNPLGSALAETAVDRVTSYAYDAAGRREFTVDALRGVVREALDAEGRVVVRVAYSAPLADGITLSHGGIAAALPGADAYARVERFAYDTAGRLQYTVDATGAVVKQEYDTAGRLTRKTAYAAVEALPATLANAWSASQIAGLVDSADANNRVTRFAWDAAGRELFSVDGMGHVQHTEHDALGRVTSVTRYWKPISVQTAGTADGIRAKLVEEAGMDRIERVDYDQAGRLRFRWDAAGAREAFEYDAVGRKTQYTNALEAVWNYTHDAAGRVKTETSPSVTLTHLQDEGGTWRPVSDPARVETRFDYDALGRLTARTEAAGRPEQRTTQYSYDALGRQVRTTLAAVALYDPTKDNLATNGASGLADRTETDLATLTTETTYDIFGDAVKGKDAGGAFSYKIHDKLGRVRYEVDPLGHVIGYEYTAFGEVWKLTRYAKPVAGVGPATKVEEMPAKVAPGALDRTVTHHYDAAGRLACVEDPATLAFDTASEDGVWQATAARSTTHTYNAFGDRIRTSDGKAETSHFFNVLGQEVASVDALGFVTTLAYDDAGNLQARKEYARAISGGTWDAATDKLPGTFAGSQSDRETTYEYDLTGRRTAEIRVAVSGVATNSTLDKVWEAELAVTDTALAPLITLSTAQSGTPMVTGCGYSARAVGSLIEWDAPAAWTSTTLSMRAAGDTQWEDVSHLAVTEDGKQRLFLAADLAPGNYEFLVRNWSYGAAVAQTLAKVTVPGAVRSVAAPVLLPAPPGTQVITGVTAGVAGGLARIEWTAPADPELRAVLQVRLAGSDLWQSLAVRQDGTKQFATLPAELPAGSYRARLEFLRLDTATRNLATRFAYDALGNLVMTEDALGGRTYNYYDALGRVKAAATPSRAGEWRLTQLLRDAHGNLVHQAERANGATAVSAEGFTWSANATEDRAQFSEYDAAGRVSTSQDAEGARRYFSYDANGRLAKSWFSFGEEADKRTVYRVNTYDAAGRLSMIVEPGADEIGSRSSGSSVTKLAYNAFGELTSQSLLGVADGEYWDYNNAGRVWRTNEGDGVDRVRVYDAQGRMTLEASNTGVSGAWTARGDVLKEGDLFGLSAGRRTINRYDALGRLVEQRLPQQAESLDAVQARRVTGSAVVTQQGTRTEPDIYTIAPVFGWGQLNKVQLEWSALGSLGSGDVKVVLSYITADAAVLYYVPPEQPDGQPGQAIKYFTPQAGTLTRAFTAEQANAGVTLEWKEDAGVDAAGIASVTSFQVYKKRLDGEWELVVDSARFAAGGTELTVDAPTDPATAVKLELRSAGSGTWVLYELQHFGDQLRLDTDAVAAGTYDYRLRMLVPGSAGWTTTATGTLDLHRAPAAALSVVLESGVWGEGVYGWLRPAEGTVETFRYRTAGSSDVWRTLAVSPSATGTHSTVNAVALVTGTYEYELVHSAADLRPVGHATGQFAVTSASGTPPLPGIVNVQPAANGTVTFDWDLPAAATSRVSYGRVDEALSSEATITGTGTRQSTTITGLGVGDHEVRMELLAGGSVVYANRYLVSVPIGSQPVPTVVGTISAAVQPALVPNVAFTTTPLGAWTLAWDEGVGYVSTVEMLKKGELLWRDFTKSATTPQAGRRLLSVSGDELLDGEHALRITTRNDQGLLLQQWNGTATISDKSIAVQPVDTTPLSCAVINATFSGKLDGSWWISWPKATGDLTVRYRKTGSTGSWTQVPGSSIKSPTASTSRVEFSATALAPGDWDVEIYYASNGVRTSQAWRRVTLGPHPVDAPAAAVDTTPQPPAVPGIGWLPNQPEGSTISWTTPPAGQTASLRVKGTASTTFVDVLFATDGMKQSYTMLPTALSEGTYDVELRYLDAMGVTVRRSTAVLTVTRLGTGYSHALVDTSPNPLQLGVAFKAMATAGDWTLSWSTPTGPVLTPVMTMTASNGATQSLTGFISHSELTNTDSVGFFGKNYAPDKYVIELAYTTASGARITYDRVEVTTKYVAPTRPTSVNTTPPAGIAKLGATISPGADGSFRLQWPKPVDPQTSQLKFRLPGQTVYRDNTWFPVQVFESPPGNYVCYIDIPDNIATGKWGIDLAVMNGTTRVAQYTADVTVAEDGLPAKMVSHLPVLFTGGANGDFTTFTWPAAQGGNASQIEVLAPGSAEWVNIKHMITAGLEPGSSQVREAFSFPGDYHVRIWHSASDGTVVAEAKGTMTVYPMVPGTPAASAAPTTYQPGSYSATSDPTPAADVLHTFTLDAEPVGLSGARFIPVAGAGATLEWDAPAVAGAQATTRLRAWGTSSWIALPVTTAAGVQSVTFGPDFPAAVYEVQVDISSAGSAVASMSGLLVVPGAAPIKHWAGAGTSSVALQPKVVRDYDRWGNLTSESDPRFASWVTRYSYNASNQLVRKEETDGDGRTGAAHAGVTTFQFDALGREIARTDANGNTSEQHWDSGGRLAKEVHADLGVVEHAYDTFGDLRQTRAQVDSATTTVTDYRYDRLGRLVETTQAATQVSTMDRATWKRTAEVELRMKETVSWDAAGNRRSVTNSLGEAAEHSYDRRGNVVQATQGGVTTLYAYSSAGRKVAEKDGNGKLATWSYDYFGAVLGRQDFAGKVYTYVYDTARQLKKESSTAGVTGSVLREYTYDAVGRLITLADKSVGQVTDYMLDVQGRRVREKVVQGGVVYADTHMAYDALGRLRWVGDARAYVTMEYDRVGNRTVIGTHVTNGVDEENDRERHFTYDAMNRQVRAHAAEDGRLGAGGHAVTYDKAGNKVSDSWMGSVVQKIAGGLYTVYVGGEAEIQETRLLPNTYKAQLGLTTERYARDALGRIQAVERDGVVVDERHYDAAGRLIESGKASLEPDYLKALNGTNNQGQVLAGNGVEVRRNVYDTAGRLAAQRVSASESADQQKYLVEYDGADAVDGAGNVKSYTRKDSSGDYRYTYTYEVGDGYRVKTLHGQRGATSEGTTTSSYDANGFLVGVDDEKQNANDRTFVNDSAGRILYANQGGHVQRQLIANGEVLGRYGEIVNDKEPRTDAGAPVFRTTADFGFGFQSTAGNTPDVPDRTHVTAAGDTLQSLAQAYYGDSRLWYRVAEANGLSSNSDLKAGAVLKIPGTEASGNASGTFRPYQPGEVVGDTSPYIPLPKKKSNWLKQLITVVIAIVVAYATQQWYLVQEGFAAVTAVGELSAASLSSTTLASVGAAVPGASTAAGAIGAAAGSIASQAAGVSMGTQDRFSWRGVAMSAISGGVSGALGGTDFGMGERGNIVARAALGNTVTQGLSIATGLQNSFSWRQVAASAVGAGVGRAAGRELGNTFGGRLATGLIAGSAAAVARGGRVVVQQVAVDAFGNALGESLASASSSAPVTSQLQPGELGSGSYGVGNVDNLLFASFAGPRPVVPAAANVPENINGLDLPGDYVFPQAAAAGEADLARADRMLRGAGTYTAQRGQGPLAVAQGLYPERPYAAMGYMAVTGQISFDQGRNRWNVNAGADYSADLGSLSADQIDALDAAARRMVAVESSVDALRDRARFAALIRSGGPRGGTGVAYGDAPMSTSMGFGSGLGNYPSPLEIHRAQLARTIADAGPLDPGMGWYTPMDSLEMGLEASMASLPPERRGNPDFNGAMLIGLGQGGPRAGLPEALPPGRNSITSELRAARQLSVSEPGSSITQGGLPTWLKERFEAGNEFNRANRGRYPYNEVEVVDSSGRVFRVDSYDPVKGEIVSRRFTQLADVKPETGISYLQELARKYPSGATISDSPFNPRVLQGQRLSGDPIFEVPVQNRPVPPTVLEYARGHGMLIRDVKGHVQ